MQYIRPNSILLCNPTTALRKLHLYAKQCIILIMYASERSQTGKQESVQREEEVVEVDEPR